MGKKRKRRELSAIETYAAAVTKSHQQIADYVDESNREEILDWLASIEGMSLDDRGQLAPALRKSLASLAERVGTAPAIAMTFGDRHRAEFVLVAHSEVDALGPSGEEVAQAGPVRLKEFGNVLEEYAAASFSEEDARDYLIEPLLYRAFAVVESVLRDVLSEEAAPNFVGVLFYITEHDGPTVLAARD